MSEFVNTVDVLGPEEFIDQFLQRTLTEFKDNRVTYIGPSAFINCPIVTVDIPNATRINGAGFNYANSLASLNIPLVKSIDYNGLSGTQSLKVLDAPSLTYLSERAMAYSSGITHLLLRSATVCVLGGSSTFDGSPLGRGAGYIYVPRTLLDSYKSATNWSTYADQFQALEDFTDDGTLDGKFVAYTISNELVNVHVTNKYRYLGPRSSYTTTLYTAAGDDVEIEEVSVTMGGVDITADVYNAETGEINIPLVTGDLVITAKARPNSDMISPIHIFTAANATSTAWVDEVDNSYQFNFTGSPTVADGYVNFTSSSHGILNKNLGLNGVDSTLVVRFVADSSKGETWVLGTPNWSNGVIVGKKSANFHIESSGMTLIRCAGADANEHEVALCFEASTNTIHAYFDGVSCGSSTAAKLSTWLNNLLYLNNEGASFNAANKIAHILIYAKMLTADEVAGIFAQGG